MNQHRFHLRLLLVATVALTVSACGGGGGSSGGGITPQGPPPTATPAVGVQGCNSTPSTASVTSFPAAVLSSDTAIRRPNFGARTTYVPGKVAVTMQSGQGHLTADALRRLSSAASIERTFDFAALKRSGAVIRTGVGNEDAVIASLRSAQGVASAQRVPYRHLESTAVTPNDTYWNVVLMQLTPKSGTPFQTMVGQWDMHFIRADFAWGFGANTQGQGVKIAIVDTGTDVTHPELAGKIVGTKCFVSGASNPTGSDVTDLDGHGTDVAGIAAEDTNNAHGFASVGFQAQLLIYKVFPNPPAAGCPPGSNDSACGADSDDIASAINDAVASGAKVINLSLGSDTPATLEEQAVANAIKAGVVVVAAAGNGDAAGNARSALDYPAADPNVIAVGASALNNSTSVANPTEYVAHYSNYSGASTTGRWGIVAPGGDPLPCEEDSSSAPCNTDYAHWIENIYSSQVPSWSCTNDRGTTFPDCKVLIAGTSQATPHVSGAAALLIGAGANPTAIFGLLCDNADKSVLGAAPAAYTTLPAIAGGCGRLDLYRAMSAQQGAADPGSGGNFGS